MPVRHDHNDEQLPNGSIIHWALQKHGKVPVSCGQCGKKRNLFAQNVTAAAFTGLCRS